MKPSPPPLPTHTSNINAANPIINTHHQRWIIIVTIMMIAILEVLDSTIVNVSLPAMMPALGANQNEITWVITSYIVASAMMLPLTGYLSQRFGQQRLLMFNISGFMLSSMLCGMSQNLTMMVICRLLQGGCGAALIPLSQSILRQNFPLEEQGKAMAIWGIGIMVAPVLGPTLGGYLSQHASWHWIFYINLPICILGLIMTSLFIPQTSPKHQPLDVKGLILMFMGVGCLQLVLDQGNHYDWFQSPLIIVLFLISSLSLTGFIIHSLKSPTPLIILHLFTNRNFSLCTMMMAIFCGAFFSYCTIQPIMLETLFHYDSITAGMTLAASGIASAFGMGISANLMKHINVKYIFATALLSMLLGSLLIVQINLNTTHAYFVTANASFGFGMGLFMVPLSTFALATIKKEQITEGSGLFSYGRMLGSSIGISLISTLISRTSQRVWHALSSATSVYNPNLQWWLTQNHLRLSNPITPLLLGQQVSIQASLLAFIHAYFIIGLLFIILLPMMLLTRSIGLSSS